MGLSFLFPIVSKAQIAFLRIDSSINVKSLPRCHDKSSICYHLKKSYIRERNRIVSNARESKMDLVHQKQKETRHRK